MIMRILLLFLPCILCRDCEEEVPGDVRMSQAENPPILLIPQSDACVQRPAPIPIEIHTETKTVVKEVVVEIDEPREYQSGIQPTAPYKPEKHDVNRPSSNEHYGKLDGTEGVQNKCYVLTMKSHGADISKMVSLIEGSGGKIRRRYNRNITGVSFCSSDGEIYNKIRNEDTSAKLEEDRMYRTASLQSNIPNHMYLMRNYGNLLLNNRLYDNWVFRTLPVKRMMRGLFGFYEYYYTGRGVSIFLLDTTVSVVTENIRNMSGSREACNKHGNIMAALLVGRTHGFAKNSRLDVLDVVGCDGQVLLSDVLHGLENIEGDGAPKILVFGISGMYSEVLNSVVNTISDSGVIVVAPSGNLHDKSCNYSPGSARSVVNVGSVDKHAKISRFSNYGDCVRIFVLGEDLLDDDDVSGTSFSAAIVASAIAIFLEKMSRPTFIQVWRYLNRNSFWNENGGYITLTIPYLGTGDSKTWRQAPPVLTEFRKNLVIYVFITATILGIAYLLFFVSRHMKKVKRERELVFDVPVDRF